jgi:hypothetical protein
MTSLRKIDHRSPGAIAFQNVMRPFHRITQALWVLKSWPNDGSLRLVPNPERLVCLKALNMSVGICNIVLDECEVLRKAEGRAPGALFGRSHIIPAGRSDPALAKGRLGGGASMIATGKGSRLSPSKPAAQGQE